MMQKREEASFKIRIKIKAYDSKLADSSAEQIIQAVLRRGGEVKGPIPLPTEVKRFTALRSTFVHKDSREQFEMRIHKRLIDILNPNPQIIDALQNINLPSGVEVEIKM